MKNYNDLRLNEDFYNKYSSLTPSNIFDIVTVPGEKSKFNYKNKISYYNYFIGGFYSDLYKFNHLVKILEKSINFDKIYFDNHLDIGAREGFISRMLKGSKYVKRTSGLDKVDLRPNSILANNFPYSLLLKFDLDKRKHYLTNQDKTGLEINRNEYYKNISSLDNFFVEDFESFSKPLGEDDYDLVTIIGTLCYLNPENFIKKLLEITTAKSDLFICSDNYFFPINSSKVVTKIPYADKFLENNEFAEFVYKEHAEEAEKLIQLKNYYMNGNPVGANGLLDLLKNNGFEILNFEYSPHIKWASEILNLEKEKIIERMKNKYPNVGEKDLISEFYWIHARRN